MYFLKLEKKECLLKIGTKLAHLIKVDATL